MQWLFKNHTYVRPYVSNSFSCVLLGQYTSDPQIFYRFGTPYKMTNRGDYQRRPDRPNPPPMVEGKNMFFLGGVLLMEHSDHQKVNKLLGDLDFKYHLRYPKEVPPPPLPPLRSLQGWYRGGLNGGGGLIMVLTPKCDIFLESPCQGLSHSAKLG